ncbi:MAG: TlpA family protein disulfide reductase [Betaproteobacteria bacterium]|nr:TlpA family protein disulfide reductase [Betaproteobacteria bacterium]
MGKAIQGLLIGLVSLAALGLGYLSSQFWNTGPGTALEMPAAGNAGAEPLFLASLPDLAGRPQAVSQWKGKVLVVNFWATWCSPCREEIPEFIQVQDKYRDRGLVFLGIAVDQAEQVRAYSKEVGINYPVLVGELDAMELSRKAGNTLNGLPFTAIIDRAGRIVGTKAGRLTQAALESVVSPLL